MIIAGTGHRPQRLGLGYTPQDNEFLTNFVRSCLMLKRFENVEHIISGMAQGFDQALAHAAIMLKIPFTAAIPFEGQEKKWPEAGQKRFNAILAKASKVEIITHQGYDVAAFRWRDEWMVDNSDGVIALWDKKDKSGTAMTVTYAIEKKKPVINMWDVWLRCRDGDS